MLHYWLLKSEPSVWSFAMQLKAGAKGEPWGGVRSHQAKNNLVAMKKGDLGFFYHSNEGKEIVGLVEVIREAYPDPTAEAGSPWIAVDVKAKASFAQPVTLANLKRDERFSKMALIMFSRLSVQPVTAKEWKLICKMGGISA